MDERFSANDIWPPYRPQCEGKWALAGKGQRNFLKPDVQTSLKADGTIQYKGDKVSAFVHRKMHKGSCRCEYGSCPCGPGSMGNSRKGEV